MLSKSGDSTACSKFLTTYNCVPVTNRGTVRRCNVPIHVNVIRLLVELEGMETYILLTHRNEVIAASNIDEEPEPEPIHRYGRAGPLDARDAVTNAA